MDAYLICFINKQQPKHAYLANFPDIINMNRYKYEDGKYIVDQQEISIQFKNIKDLDAQFSTFVHKENIPLDKIISGYSTDKISFEQLKPPGFKIISKTEQQIVIDSINSGYSTLDIRSSYFYNYPPVTVKYARVVNILKGPSEPLND